MHSLTRKTTLICPLLLVAFLACNRSVASGQAAKVVILAVLSHEAVAYRQALEGFRNGLAGQGIKADMDEINLAGNQAAAAQALDRLKRDRIDVLFTLGSLAADTMIRENSGLPMVAGLVLSEDEIKSKPNVTGVFLDISSEIQLRWMVRLLPQCRNIGVLYSQARFQRRIEAASKIAQDMGLKVQVKRIEKLSELPDELEFMLKSVNVIWGIPDETIFNSRTAQHILLKSFENRVPLVGISRAWAKAGAIYSLDANYEDVGRQCAETATAILRGAKADSIPPASPRKVGYSLNLKTAQHMRIDFSEDLVQGADEVFR
jgi:putative ABC transport system substrate-binding protein